MIVRGGGRVVELETHESLMSVASVYRDLVESQIFNAWVSAGEAPPGPPVAEGSATVPDEATSAPRWLRAAPPAGGLCVHQEAP